MTHSSPQPATPPRDRQQPAAQPTGRRQRFALGLAIYTLLTLAAFGVFLRYIEQIRRFYGYDIQNSALQFGLLFAIYLTFTTIALLAAMRLPMRLGTESRMRIAFVAGATLTVIVAWYQSRHGAISFVNYMTVGTLGTFAAVALATTRRYGLVEVIARPPLEIVAAVRDAHAGIPSARGGYDRAKRLLDGLLAIAIIAISLPISLPLVIALWLQDPGPLLVAKVAVKRGGLSFRQLKLRTMVKDAEVATGPVPAAPDDRRVTWLGGLLRRTHIDELPQMLNIAWGDMSLVGPRPERTVFVHRHLSAVPGYARRHAVRPGLAGLAQVFGDYYSTPREKLRYDLLYIRRRGFSLDARLFGSALMVAFLGIRPRRRGRERALARPHSADRFDKAYRALRGEE